MIFKNKKINQQDRGYVQLVGFGDAQALVGARFHASLKLTTGYTRLVDFSDAILSRAKGASPKFTTGYTIIETMISVSLFLVVVTSGMGALLNANLLYNKSQNMRSILDNLNFIMEDMSRNIRTGYGIRCLNGVGDDPANISIPKSCSSGYAIAFESALGIVGNDLDQWVYFISGPGKFYKSDAGISNFIQLTPQEVDIDLFNGFSVLGAESVASGNQQQPLVTIRLVGKIVFKNVITPFSLQTSVSQRLIDI